MRTVLLEAVTTGLLAKLEDAGIRALPQGLGLNAYLRSQSAATLEVPVLSPGILCDLDTPADYERLRAEFAELNER